MANKGRSGKGRRGQGTIITIGVVAAIVLFFIFNPEGIRKFSDAEKTYAPVSTQTPSKHDNENADNTNKNASEDPTAHTDGNLEVFFLDVGQGDSIYIESPNGKTMLIDTSENAQYSVIESFLKSRGVERLDAVVATHPHSDHMGGMHKVIKNFEIGEFYLPEAENTSAAFEKMISALEDNDVSTNIVWADETECIAWDDDVEIKVLSPWLGHDYDLNNFSIVLRLVYGKTSLLLTGDAENYAENIMMDHFIDEELESTVIKIGHHGSSSSTGERFFDAVNPKAAVIEVGADNDYGHPHRETMALLKKWGGQIFRTDLNGNIHFTLDGSTYRVETEK